MTVWIEVQVEVGIEAAELVAEVVGEITGGVEVRDSGTLIGAAVGRASIVALCAPERVDELMAEVDAVCARAREAGLPVDPVQVRRREAHEDEWRDVWKQYFRATRVGDRFIVRPSWDPGSGTIRDGDRVIDLDPGRAFGTGGHASTRLVIALAERLAADPVGRFLDLGCGSGILAIAAALLWPGAEGVAADNDPEATACAQENLDRNKITSVRVATGTLHEVAGRFDGGFDVGFDVRFDVILANIQADVLLPLADELRERVAPGGALILSGLLTSQAATVAERYGALGFHLNESRDEDEWTALRFTATGTTPRAESR